MKILRVLVLILSLTILSFGQSSNKVFVLSGTVYDINKAIVPATEILIKDINNKSYKTKTNDSGEYEIILPVGVYTVEFSSIGFKTLRVINLEISSVRKTLNVTLEAGRCEDCNGAIYGKRWDDYSVLSGVIYDSHGAVIENAQLSFRDAGNKKRNVKTDKTGTYKIIMPNGIYSIEINAVGFRTFKIEKYKATGTRNGMKFDAVLEVKNCDDPTVRCSSITTKSIKNKGLG